MGKIDSVAVFGGTFDPVHVGHLTVANQLMNLLGFRTFYWSPSHTSWQKSGVTAPKHRLEMLKLALSDQPSCHQIDCGDLQQASDTISAQTLERFRAKLGWEISISFVLGLDCFIQLPSWYRWRDLLGLANLVVYERPGFSWAEVPNELSQQVLLPPLAAPPPIAGAVFACKQAQVPLLACSSTQIREQVQAKKSLDAVVPPLVQAYIQQYQLYSK